MFKPVVAATALLALAGSSYVYAQQDSDGHRGFGDRGPRAEHQHHRLSADDVSAFADARIAALKAGLELTPDQAKDWPAFEGALRNMVQLRMQRRQARQAAQQQAQSQSPTQGQSQSPAQGQSQSPAQGQSQTSPTPFDRMGRRADAMGKMSAALKQIADTGAPLYQSLTDQQKARFTMLARMLRPHQRQQGDRGGWRQGRGYGRDGRGPDGYGHGQDGRRFGQNGRGWGHGGHRFAQNDQGWGRRSDRQSGDNGRGPGGRMHHRMNGDGDQDSQL